MHSGNAAAMPLVRNAATFSFCHASRSVRITTAILVSNCMSYSGVIPGWSEGPDLRRAIAQSWVGKTPSPPLRGLQRLRGVDIEEGAKAFDRDFRHRLAMLGDQMTRTDIAVERHQLVEE